MTLPEKPTILPGGGGVPTWKPGVGVGDGQTKWRRVGTPTFLIKISAQGAHLGGDNLWHSPATS